MSQYDINRDFIASLIDENRQLRHQVYLLTEALRNQTDSIIRLQIRVNEELARDA